MLEYIYRIQTRHFKSEQVAFKAMRRWSDKGSPVMDDAAGVNRLGILQFSMAIEAVDTRLEL